MFMISDYFSLQQGAALVHIYTDGSVLLCHGGVEIGQGLNTKMIQVSEKKVVQKRTEVFM